MKPKPPADVAISLSDNLTSGFKRIRVDSYQDQKQLLRYQLSKGNQRELSKREDNSPRRE